MGADDMDAFRAELLRQKIIFEAELRRQRETFDDRLSRMAQDLADREADCRNLQAVVTILGKKVDALMERRGATPQRRSSPARSGSTAGGDESFTTARCAPRAVPLSRAPSPTGMRRSSPFRRAANASLSASAASASASAYAAAVPHAPVHHAPSLYSVGSRQNSPARVPNVNGQRPRLGHDGVPDLVTRRSSAYRV